MLSGLKNSHNTLKYEPMLIDLLDPPITKQEARILGLLLKYGGYITLNSIADLIDMAQPTVSNNVSELTKKGYIRKNPEVQPIALVFLLNLDNLKVMLAQRHEMQKQAAQFLQKAVIFDDLIPGADMLTRAFQRIYPRMPIFSQLLTQIYLKPLISRSELFQCITPDQSLTSQLEKHYDHLLEQHQDIIQIIYTKHRKGHMYFQPRLPLDLLGLSRWAYLESINTYYTTLIQELQDSVVQKSESIIPHQLLHFPYEIKSRIDTCLKYYDNVRLINNHIYQVKEKKLNILKVITESKHYSAQHVIHELADRTSYLFKHLNPVQIEQKKIQKNINPDYLRRDFVLFGNHGCLIIPPVGRGIPYYNIAPTFISSIAHIFESTWEVSNAN